MNVGDIVGERRKLDFCSKGGKPCHSFAAAGYIAKRLAPFCEKSEIEIRRTCDYIRTTGKI